MLTKLDCAMKEQMNEKELNKEPFNCLNIVNKRIEHRTNSVTERLLVFFCKNFCGPPTGACMLSSGTLLPTTRNGNEYDGFVKVKV